MKTFEAYQAIAEAALPPALDALGPVPEKLREAMRYSLLAGGKRLRPVLALAAADLLGVGEEEILPYACALEMIHTYSLIHDDLPAMDADDLRRGRPTSHKVFGEAVAILAGDGLLHGAMETMLRAASAGNGPGGVRAAEAVARRSGVTGMVAGQTIDVTCEGQTPMEERVAFIHAHKTADLIIAPLEAAACLAGVPEARKEALCAYGLHLGLTFQIVDDLLDVLGDEAALGKRTGMDAAAGKQTWVALRGIEGAREDAAAHTRQAVEALAPWGEDAAFFADLARGLLTRVS